MTREEIAKLQALLRKAEDVDREIAQLTDGVDKGLKMMAINIVFSETRFNIEVALDKKGDGAFRFQNVCWAEDLLGNRRNQIREAFVDVVREVLEERCVKLANIKLNEAAKQ